jgi:hypothetical protein
MRKQSRRWGAAWIWVPPTILSGLVVWRESGFLGILAGLLVGVALMAMFVLRAKRRRDDDEVLGDPPDA